MIEQLPRIAIVGEALGDEEVAEGRPFVGSAGRFLRAMLHQSGIDAKHCLLTNVFNLRPWPRLDISSLCGGKATAIKGYPPIGTGKYIEAKYVTHIQRLYRELDEFRPTLIIALGATAAWALLHSPGIKKVRGAPLKGYGGYKVLPTYHPSTILRQYNLYPVFVSDLQKAAREAKFSEIRRPERFIHVEPTYDDLLAFEQEFIVLSPALSIDIETAQNQITCIGIAPSANRALVIPFTDDTKASHNYWPDLETEVQVWKWVRRICGLKKSWIVGQNFNYDMKFLLQSYGIPVRHANHDIMLLHHALQPELEKSLGWMASIYSDELAWKFMRPKHTVKKED